MEGNQKPTKGMSMVRMTFNPSRDANIDKLKGSTAQIIDYLETVSGIDPSEEKDRCTKKAQDLYEEACMYAVKALTA